MRLASGNPGCPSDFALDRLQAGELGEAQASSLRQHIAQCSPCEGRMATRQAGFAALVDLDERRMLATIRRRLDEDPPSVRSRLLAALRRLSVPLVAATGLAVLAVVLIGRAPLGTGRAPGTDPGTDPRTDPGTDPGTDQTREKGGLSLSVFRLVDGHAQQALSGDHFAAGDRLRFVVDLPSAGQVAVLGVESQGGLYVAWPTLPRDTQRPAGKKQELPGAVALDASVGKETLYLVLCPSSGPAPSSACEAAGSVDAVPRCPRGCQLSAFVLNKN